MTEETRFERGLRKLEEVDGTAGNEVVAPLGDLGRYIVEFAFGDIYSRGELTLREREIAAIAMLTVMGGREPQLKVHLGAGLNVGLTPKEIEEIIIQTVPYSGFPTAINALHAFKQIQADKKDA
jgi:4-carboxymuconolactone decarboxylase